MGAQGGGKWSPSRTQIGPKSKTEKKMRKEALQNRLEEVLGSSGSRLGTILGHLDGTRGHLGTIWRRLGGQNHCFSFVFSILFETSSFRTKMVILSGLERSWGFLARTWGLLDRTWTDFGAQEVPKGTPKGTQEAPKKSPK